MVVPQNWPRVPLDDDPEMDVKHMFSEALRAWGIQVHGATVRYLLLNTSRIHNNVPLTTTNFHNLITSYHAFIVASLGLYSLVYPYERYNKLLEPLDPNADAGMAFGLDKYDNLASFRQAFPQAHIIRWNNNAASAQDVDDNTQMKFAAIVRNLFAHGQSHIYEGNAGYKQTQVEISNYKPPKRNLLMNFCIRLTLEDFARLVKQALSNFIAAVVIGEIYKPLGRLLNLDITFEPDDEEIPDEH